MKHETEEERTSRNWDELRQELRVTQTGTQIFAGFLLALVLSGTVLFIFDIVVDLGVGIAAAIVTVVVLVAAWIVIPSSVRANLPDHEGRTTSPPAPEE